MIIHYTSFGAHCPKAAEVPFSLFPSSILDHAALTMNLSWSFLGLALQLALRCWQAAH